MVFPEGKTGEITVVAYLISIPEVVKGVQQDGTGAVLTVKDYILGLI